MSRRLAAGTIEPVIVPRYWAPASHSPPLVETRWQSYLAGRTSEAAIAIDLGCGDGLRTQQMPHHFRQSIGVEFRHQRYQQALNQKQLFGSSAEFVQADVTALPVLPTASLLVVIGLLHHLAQPWLLLEQLAELGDEMYLCTNVADAPEEAYDLSDATEVCGWTGRWYRESPTNGYGGVEPYSFWPYGDSLRKMLWQVGWCTYEPFPLQRVGKFHRMQLVCTKGGRP